MTLLQPAGTQIYPKETHPDKKVSLSDVTSESSVAGCDLENGRITLDEWKLYLDSCATYHSAFVAWMLENVQIVNAVLCENCNAGVTETNRKGYCGLFEFWLNEHGIANLLSILQLEKDGFIVDYNTNQN